jgi:surface antigen
MRGMLKAIVGAVLAGATAAGTALETHSHITLADAGVIALAVVAGFNGVYWTSNNSGKVVANVKPGDSDSNRGTGIL